MGATDQPRYNGFRVIRDRVITALQCIRYHRSISLNSINLTVFLREKVNEEIGYNSKRGRDWINLPSMPPTGIHDPFCVIDFPS